jgi:hypothetical protein
MNPHADQSRKVSLTRSAITTVCIHNGHQFYLGEQFWFDFAFPVNQGIC